MDHDAVAALLGNPTAIISDADWLAIDEHFAVCDLCTAGPAVLAAAVQGELSLIRFGLEAGRSIFRPWWLGGPIIGLMIMVGILSYVFFSGAPAQPVVPTPTPTPMPTATATAIPTPTVTPTSTFTPMPGPTLIAATEKPAPSTTPSPSPTTTMTPGPPVATATPTSTLLRTPSLCPANCVLTVVLLVGTAREDATYADELLQLTNGKRLEVGLDPLLPNERLLSAAQGYAEFVVLSEWWKTHPYAPDIHCDADCHDMYVRALSAGYPAACIGENVMGGTVDLTAKEMWSIVMAGPHEDPAKPVFRYVGVACYRRDDLGEFACVQVLGAEEGTPCPE